MSTSQIVQFDAAANRIFVFDAVCTEPAAQALAERRKLGAFGLLARWNPLHRPKEDTVELVRQELRLEPFWHLSAQRSVDYHRQVHYPVPVHNPDAREVSLLDTRREVTRHGDRGRLDLSVVEHCQRRLTFETFVDGLQREIRPTLLEHYLARYPHTEVDTLDRPELVRLLVPQAAARQRASDQLNAEAIDADEIELDILTFERLHLFVRPVYAFEFLWSTTERTGVIEVDGLTGEAHENGHWFRDKMNQVLTRDMLVDLGAEISGTLRPDRAAPPLTLVDRLSP